MQHPFETTHLTKRFDETTALDGVDLAIRSHSIVGLLGRNGSGKTTLMHHLMGLQLPTEGSATTLGRRSDLLTHEELTHIGFVPQEIRLLDWMTVGQHLGYVSTFYPSWDGDRETRLVEELELDREASVGSLSTGNLQKLAVLLAVCHHPTLLVLDEPVSDLDPIVRTRLLEFLLEVVREDQATILISSHVLRDVEKIVDWVVCLEGGRLVTDASLDDLKERYAEWRVLSRAREAPAGYTEAFVLAQELSGREGRLLVDRSAASKDSFEDAHDVEVAERPLNLEEMFPLLVREPER
jgi:ABC-2 type transport system ATP-binding protein